MVDDDFVKFPKLCILIKYGSETDVIVDEADNK